MDRAQWDKWLNFQTLRNEGFDEVLARIRKGSRRDPVRFEIGYRKVPERFQSGSRAVPDRLP